MEASSAFNFASNVVQFLDFGLRVLSKGNKIYRSVDGALEENLDLEVVTSELLIMQMKLKCTRLTSGHTHLAPDEVETFSTLKNSCVDVAGKLLERLNMVKAQGRFRRWKSLRQALKVVWSKEEIENTKDTLESLRSHCDFESFESSHSTTRLDKTASPVFQALKDDVDVFDASLTPQSEMLESDILPQRTNREIRSSIQTTRWRTNDLDEERQWLDCAVSAIIASLSFPGMNNRYERLVDAHVNTYSWIFGPDHTTDQPWDSFTSWLAQEEGASIYWLSGRAASGKSTLMRYIMENRRELHNSLRPWTKGRALVIPKFFFWSTGTVMQKSQNGLFCSLLHQIFSQDRDLVQEFLPDLVHSTLALPPRQLSQLKHRRSWRRWSLNELKQTLSNVVKRTKMPNCYFFLIDGLDEYDGDYVELSVFLKSLSTLSNVKLCLSGRPLPAFEHHFGGVPGLRLQDLTVGDISRFVRGKLQEHPRFYALSKKEPQNASSLINEIVQTSCGVFLWASLVVKSLVEALTNNDGLPDIRKRLRDLPSELEGLYSTMLGSINPPLYREQASRLLQLVYQSPSPLSPAELSYADDEDQSLVFKLKMGPNSIVEIERRAKTMVPRLTSRCAGLLEVQFQDPRSQKTNFWPFDEVQYLHRTVREYLDRPDVWSDLVKLTVSSGFNASLSLARAKLLTFKMVGSLVTESDVRDFARLALQAEESTGKGQTTLLQAFDETGFLIAQGRNGDSGRNRVDPRFHRTNAFNIRDEELAPCELCHRCPNSLLLFAVRHGLTLSVRDFLHQSSHPLQTIHQHRSLLDYATWYHSEHSTTPTIRPSMIALLLFEEGLRPNDDDSCGSSSTPWQSFLDFLAEGDDDVVRKWTPPPSPWLDVCRLFVLFGANVSVGSTSGSRGKWRSTGQVLESAFKHLPGEPLRELKDMILDRCGNAG